MGCTAIGSSMRTAGAAASTGEAAALVGDEWMNLAADLSSRRRADSHHPHTSLFVGIEYTV